MQTLRKQIFEGETKIGELGLDLRAQAITKSGESAEAARLVREEWNAQLDNLKRDWANERDEWRSHRIVLERMDVIQSDIASLARDVRKISDSTARLTAKKVVSKKEIEKMMADAGYEIE